MRRTLPVGDVIRLFDPVIGILLAVALIGAEIIGVWSSAVHSIGPARIATLALAAILVTRGILYVAAARGVFRVSRGIAFVILFWMICLPAALAVGSSEYALEKRLLFFSLTLVTSLGAAVLVRSSHGLRALYAGLTVVTAVYCILLLTYLPMARVGARLTVEGIGPITGGRAGGLLAILGFLGYAFERKTVLRIVLLGLAFLGFFAMGVSGTRGAILGSLVGVLAIAYYTRRVAWKETAIFMGTASVLSIVLVRSPYIDLFRRAIDAFERILQTGGTGEVRSVLYREAFRAVLDNPFGIGIGSFADVVIVMESMGLVRWPHNILIEMALEFGWICLLVFLLFLGLAIVNGIRRVKQWPSRENALVLALLIFALINAQFSGDVNHNRLVFAAVFMLVGAGNALAVRKGELRGSAWPENRYGEGLSFNRAAMSGSDNRG